MGDLLFKGKQLSLPLQHEKQNKSNITIVLYLAWFYQKSEFFIFNKMGRVILGARKILVQYQYFSAMNN